MRIPGNARVDQNALAEFAQKLAMLLEAGYDECNACEMLAERTNKRKDRSTDGIVRVAELLLPELREGFSLSESMKKHPRQFSSIIKQVEIGEKSGRLSAVLKRICAQLKSAGKLRARLNNAMAYPIAVLLFTFGAAWYLFSTVVPDLLKMLKQVGVSNVPEVTRIVMDAAEWFQIHKMTVLIVFLSAVLIIWLYARTIGRATMSALVCRLPLIGHVIQHNAMAIFFRSWEDVGCDPVRCERGKQHTRSESAVERL